MTTPFTIATGLDPDDAFDPETELHAIAAEYGTSEDLLLAQYALWRMGEGAIIAGERLAFQRWHTEEILQWIDLG